MIEERTPTEFVLSNGNLWIYFNMEMVHLFSLGDWLLSYQVPLEISLQNCSNVVDRGNSAVFKYFNGLIRTVSLEKNILNDISLLSHLYTVNVVLENSLHFRGWNGLPLIKKGIVTKKKNEYMRHGYPKIKISKNDKFTVFCSFSKARDTTEQYLPYEDWIDSKLKVETPERSLNNLFHNSLRSLYKLRLLTPEGQIKAAGFPSFPSLFGRDFSISALGEIYVSPLEVQEEARIHLKHLGKKVDVFRGEYPGRAPHEFTFDVESQANRYTNFPNWYSNDANPLLLITIFRLGRLQHDFTLIDSYSEQILHLWTHMLSLDLDHDNLIEYEQKPGQFVIHQTWRDGGDQIQYPDGGRVKQPIAPIHDQLCMIGAMKEILLYQKYTGKSPIGLETNELEKRIRKLQKTIEEEYWMPSLSAYALALDGDNEQVKIVNSDICLGYYYTVFNPIKARIQYHKALIDVNRLLDSIGLRTISKEHPVYSANSYQQGGVWPWQLALIIAGLSKYQLDVQPLIRCLQKLAREGSIAEVYVAEKTDPTPLSACIEQRWSSAVLWLALIEGILIQEVNYENEAPKGNMNIDESFHQIRVKNFPLKGKKFEIIVNKEGRVEIY